MGDGYWIGTREMIFETAGASNFHVHFNRLNALRYIINTTIQRIYSQIREDSILMHCLFNVYVSIADGLIE